jgi:DNA mismatch repair protein MutS2
MTHAARVLEFDTILQRLAFHCEMTLGAELAAALESSFDPNRVWAELERTSQAHKLLAALPVPSLGGARDNRSGLQRASKGGSLGGIELFQVGEALSAMRNFKNALQGRKGEFPRLWDIAQSLPELKLLEEQLSSSLDSGGEVRDSASAELARLRQRKQSATSRILERIQSYTSGKNRELLSDPIYTVRDGRYVVPVKVEYRGKVRGIVHDTSGSGQTLFVEPEDVLQLGNALREVEAAEREEVRRILAELSAKVGKASGETLTGLGAAAELDFLLAKARLAYDMKASMPQKWQGHGIVLQAARHPLLDINVAVPIDLSVGFEFQGLLITGPNTGGKTVAIKTVGLYVLMAQAGLFLPAIDVNLGPFTQIWADIGDEQSLEQSLSTFSGHIKNIADALKHLKPGALVLFDEIGAGTDPAEGAALAKAILLAIQERGGCIVASTHYGELKAFAYNTDGFRNAAMEFDVKSLRPTYKVLMGAPGASHALRIAERYGLPKEIVEQAREGMSAEEQHVGKMLEQLELSQRQARIAQGEADRRSAEVRKIEETASRKLAEAEEIRKNVHSRASETIEEALRDIRAEASRLFEELKSSPRDSRLEARVREQLKDLNEYGTTVARDIAPKQAKRQTSQVELKKGMTVKIAGYAQAGVILEGPKNGQIVVQMGPLKLTADASSATPAETPKAATAKARPNIGLARAQSASTELHLRAMRAEDAIEELERFLDDAVLAGIPQLRIVHGKGEGILRKITQDVLRRNRNVERYRDGEANEGGHGVTIAYLK